MIKIALIGAGYVGEIHVNAYKQIKNVEIVAVVDKVEEKGIKLAESLKAKYYKNIDELLKNDSVDCVDICVPTFLHHEIVLKAADAGKNIFCEKPLALSLAEADEMIKVINTKKVKAMVGHVLRFWPEYVKVKEYIDSGMLGKPLIVFCERLAVTADWRQGNWDTNEKYSGGVTLDLHIHDLDYLIWLLGKPTIVKAQGIYDPINKEAGGFVHIFSSFKFKNGAIAFAEGGWRFKGAFPFTMVLRILCEKGTVEWIFRAGKNIEERSQQAKIKIYKNDDLIEILEAENKDAFLAELSYFIECIEKNKPIKNANFEDGRASLEVALATVKSAKEQSVVKL